MQHNETAESGEDNYCRECGCELGVGECVDCQNERPEPRSELGRRFDAYYLALSRGAA
jgi:hypothetical protein